MKKLVSLFVVLVILLSCEKEEETENKDFLIPENEVPAWLKTYVEQKGLKEEPISAWVRYSWQNTYYFECLDMTSSFSYAIPVSFNGDTLFTQSQEIISSELYKSYQKDKCCKTYVWKSNGYSSVIH